jgi:hypothetical protein
VTKPAVKEYYFTNLWLADLKNAVLSPRNNLIGNLLCLLFR